LNTVNTLHKLKAVSAPVNEENQMQIGVLHKSEHLNIRASVARFDIVEDRAFIVLHRSRLLGRGVNRLIG
jgi:hypothetical protein